MYLVGYQTLEKLLEQKIMKFLLFKLESYGVRDICIDWFRSHLNNRTQIVANIHLYSNTLAVECGVPQGYIIRPLMFLIYVNDFPSSCDDIAAFLCAAV